MIIYNDEFCNCNEKQRDKFLDKFFSLLYEVSETWSEEDELSMEDEFHAILSELLYKYLCFINAGASGEVKKVDKFEFNRLFSLFTNSFLDDEFQIDVDPDSHICDYSPDGVCVVCGSTKHDFDCSSCDCWDSDREGCTLPSCDMDYACPADSETDYPY